MAIDNYKDIISGALTNTFNANNMTYDSWLKMVLNDGYTLATDDDFLLKEYEKDGETIEYIQYHGEAEYVIVPFFVGPYGLRNMHRMFGEGSTPVKGVASYDDRVLSLHSMFEGATLESLELKYFNSSKVVSMSNMFKGVTIDILDLTGLDSSQVKYMELMFSHARIKELIMSTLDTSSVDSMYAMFGYSQIDNLDISTLNTSKVTSMDYMFANTSYETLDFSNFNTENVEEMYYMFAFTNFKHLILKSFNTSKVSGMAKMFIRAKFESIDISSFDTSNVIHSDGMFMHSNIKPEDVMHLDLHNVEDARYMFYDTEVTLDILQHLSIPDTADIENMFSKEKTDVPTVEAQDTSEPDDDSNFIITLLHPLLYVGLQIIRLILGIAINLVTPFEKSIIPATLLAILANYFIDANYLNSFLSALLLFMTYHIFSIIYGWIFDKILYD